MKCSVPDTEELSAFPVNSVSMDVMINIWQILQTHIEIFTKTLFSFFPELKIHFFFFNKASANNIPRELKTALIPARIYWLRQEEQTHFGWVKRNIFSVKHKESNSDR